MQQLPLHPGLVRFSARNQVLYVIVVKQLALLGVHANHLTRSQPALLDDSRRVERDHAGLGAHDDRSVRCELVTRRAQAVAVQGCTDEYAVGKSHARRPIPWLAEAGVVLVKRTPIFRHVGHVLPRLWDEHHESVADIPAGHYDRLEHVVEARRVTAARLHQRHQLLDAVAPDLGFQAGLAGSRPIHVAVQRIDLAVVGQHAEWL